MSHLIVLNQKTNNWNEFDRTIILGFIEYLFNELYIKSPVTIKLEKGDMSNIDIGLPIKLRMAFVDLENRLIIIYTNKRGILDIIRSIAHELIHVQQYDTGMLDLNTNIGFYLPDENSPGYDIEYEAYGLSGILVRNYRAILNKDA